MGKEDKLLNFNEKRIENIEKKRRNFERILFNNFLGAYSVIDQAGVVYPIDLVDISREGLSFRVPIQSSKSSFGKGSEFSMRMYFTKDSYIPVVATIMWSKQQKGDDGMMYLEYGCQFDKSVRSFKALENFIEFMYSFAEHSTVDKGDQKIYYI